MNTSQLLLVSSLGLAVNLFGMFAMGGHHHHVCHESSFIYVRALSFVAGTLALARTFAWWTRTLTWPTEQVTRHHGSLPFP